MTQKIINSLLALGLVVAVALTFHSGGQTLGGSLYDAIPHWFGGGVQVGLNQEFTVSNSGAVSTAGDTTVSGGTLTLTTSNAASSTVSAGCFQGYATSTATPIQLSFTAGFAGSTTYSGSSNGAVLWKFGACPNL